MKEKTNLREVKSYPGTKQETHQILHYFSICLIEHGHVVLWILMHQHRFSGCCYPVLMSLAERLHCQWVCFISKSTDQTYFTDEVIDEQVTHTALERFYNHVLRGLIMSLNGNTIANESSSNCGIKEKAWELALPSLYFTIFPPALLLNLVVAWICLYVQTKSTFTVYLKHLVVADLLMTLTFPIRGASELPGASPGLRAFACRFSSVFFYLAMNMSVLLMGLISLDRYLKIVRSGGSLLCQNLLFSNVLSVVFWIALISSNTLPIIITSNQDPTNKTGEFCIAMKSKLGLSWHKAVVMVGKVIFWAVCILNVFCYTCIAKTVLESYQRSRGNNDKRKRKAKLRVFLILLVFIICYLPYHCIRIPYTKLQVKDNNSTCYKRSLKIGKDFTLWLSALNVCLDPLIYFFLCKAFREKFWEICGIKRLFPSFGEKNDACQSTDTF